MRGDAFSCLPSWPHGHQRAVETGRAAGLEQRRCNRTRSPSPMQPDDLQIKVAGGSRLLVHVPNRKKEDWKKPKNPSPSLPKLQVLDTKRTRKTSTRPPPKKRNALSPRSGGLVRGECQLARRSWRPWRGCRPPATSRGSTGIREGSIPRTPCRLDPGPTKNVVFCWPISCAGMSELD